jgi:hypothetical protein
MTMRQRRTLRAIAAGSALGLTAGTVAALGIAGPAAARTTLDFDCTTLIGPQVFPVDLDTNAPAKLPTGSSKNPTVTALLTVPASLADLMRGIGVTDLVGSVSSALTVDGTQRDVAMSIPKTGAGSAGDAVLTATGKLGTITGGAPGSSTVIGASDQVVTIDLLNAAGDVVMGDVAIPCTPVAGQDTTVDTVEVVKAGSRTNAQATYKGRKDKAVGKAKVRASNGIGVNGKVKFVLKRGKKTVAKKTDGLNKRDIAKVTFKKIRRPGKYKVVAKYLGSDRLKTSKDVARFRVRR